jgi:hypothetical protein
LLALLLALVRLWTGLGEKTSDFLGK